MVFGRGLVREVVPSTKETDERGTREKAREKRGERQNRKTML